MTSSNNPKKHWFALKVFYNKVFAIEEVLLKKNIECYIPCETVKVLKQDGTKKNVRKPVINSLLFFHSETYIAKEIQNIFIQHLEIISIAKVLENTFSDFRNFLNPVHDIPNFYFV